MFGTLIGIFLTSTGIVIGADTVLWGSSAPHLSRIEKTCTPSQRSVAAFEGWYGERLSLHQQFQSVCKTLSRSRKPVPVDEQADLLIRKLMDKYREQQRLSAIPAAAMPAPGNPHIAFVAVAGFDGTMPQVAVRELRWEKTRKGQWSVKTAPVGKLSFDGCGARFLGDDAVAALLLDRSAHFDRDKQRPEVSRAIEANRQRAEDNCFLSAFSVEDAKALYKLAVRATIDHGETFQMENGAVGGQLHLLTIPSEGPIQKVVIDPEQYVE
ncbi:MAG: hypothetical protein CAF44_013865 [Nitrospira sp. CG24D]|mgnify:FL=1|nr:MAG: hypothetical protein CAF44_013865 [Nitrospira sp. CG24D]